MSVQVQQVDLLANKLMEQIKILHEAKPKQRGTFAEPETQNDFQMSLGLGGIFHVQSGNLLIMALGAALSGVVAGFVNRFLGTLSTTFAGAGAIIGGLLGKKFIGKSGAMADFFSGVMIAGVAQLLGGFIGGIGGGTTTTAGTMFGERKAAFREPQYGQTPTNYLKGTGYSTNGISRPVAF